MSIFPPDNQIPGVPLDTPPKPARKRAKKTIPKIAVDSPVVPSPILHPGSVENSAQNGQNTSLSPIFPIPVPSQIGQGVTGDTPPLVDTLLQQAEQAIFSSSGIPQYAMLGPHPIALVCSDVHLSPGPPAARIEESDWLKATEAQMLWLFAQAKTFNVPLVIAGDIFDKAIADSRFISWVIALFRQCEVPIYAVPGNHDLPYHSYANMHESAYGLLETTGAIKNIDQNITYRLGDRDITLHGYYWNRPFSDPPPFDPNHINIAVIHKYVYDSNSGYFGADLSGRYDNQLTAVQCNYDFLIYGDNHTPFSKQTPTRSVLINCGSFFRRSQNDKHLTPAAYLLKADRSFDTLYVPLDGQAFLQKDDTPIVSAKLPDYSELSEFFEEQESGIDNLTIRDSFTKFIIAMQPSATVKEILSRITEISLL